MVYLSSSLLTRENDVCVATGKILKVRTGFLCHHYVMVLVLKGRGTYLEEDTGVLHSFEEGDIFQRFPGRSHAQYFDTDDNQQFFLKVPESLYWLMEERGQLNASPVLKMKRLGAVREFDECLRECQSENSGAFALWRVKELIERLHSMSKSDLVVDDIVDKAKKIIEQSRSAADVVYVNSCHLVSQYPIFFLAYQEFFAPGH
jgi:hypothetical protein